MALKKSEKKLLKILAGVAVVSGVILYRVFNPAAPDSIESVTTSVTDNTAASSASRPSSSRGGRGGGSRGGGSSSSASPSGVTLNDFKNHNTPDNCWIVIQGEVFDVSNYITNNESQAATVGQYCGTLGFEVGIGSQNTELTQEILQQSQGLGSIK